MQETNNTAISNMPEHLQPTEIEILNNKLEAALFEQERLRNSLLEELDKNAKLIYQNMDLSMEKDRQEAREFKENDSIIATLINVLTNNPKFVNNIASALADHESFNMRGDIDYTELADSLSYYQLAENISLENLAEQFDNGDIADWVKVDMDDLVSNIDYTELAEAIDYEETIRDEVRERISDLEIRNVTLTIGS